MSRKLPHLSKAEGVVLGLYSFGMVLTRSSGLTTIAVFLGYVLGKQANTVRQQLREFNYDGEDKRGRQRRSVTVEHSFGALLSWVLSWWASDDKRLALVLDATSFREVFVVLAISVVYRGCALPVAWCVLPAEQKSAWRPHWERLLRLLDGYVPPEWTVIVLADRGLYAKWLYKAIVKLKWHPFLRIKDHGYFRPVNCACFRPLKGVVTTDHPFWSGSVTIFKTPSAQLTATLLAGCVPEQREPWLILTDWPPQTAEIAWYALRAWIEAGFKDFKRGGWDWQQTKMTDPERASRLWLVMSVATVWVLSVGGYAEAELPATTFPNLPPYFPYRSRSQPLSRPRLVSCFLRGTLIILAALLRGDQLPFGDFVLLPWPTAPHPNPLC